MRFELDDFDSALGERFRHTATRMAGSQVRTPRELAALLTVESADAENAVSLTARGFYRIRRWAADVLDVDPRSITPETRWADLLPDRATRQIVWAHFHRMLGISQTPQVGRPRTVTWPIAILTSAAGFRAGLVAGTITSSAAAFFCVGAIVAVAILWLLLRLTRSWAFELMPAELTVGATAHYAVAYGSPILGDLTQPSTLAQTLEVVQALARLEIGVPRVDPDATWQELAALAQAG